MQIYSNHLSKHMTVDGLVLLNSRVESSAYDAYACMASRNMTSPAPGTASLCTYSTPFLEHYADTAAIWSSLPRMKVITVLYIRSAVAWPHILWAMVSLEYQGLLWTGLLGCHYLNIAGIYNWQSRNTSTWQELCRSQYAGN